MGGAKFSGASTEFKWKVYSLTDGSLEYRYPSQLILIDRRHNKKLKDEHIIFRNVIGKYFPGYAKGPRALETELLFHVPRSRWPIDFYAPFVAHASS